MYIMKQLSIIILLSLWMTSCSKTHESSHVPNAAIEAFNAKFPGAEKVEWEVEEEGVWEAEFVLGGSKYSSNFKEDGTWLETERQLSEDELPSDISSLLKQQFMDFEVEGAELVETPEGKSYEIDIEKAEKLIEVIIDSQGNLSSKELEDEKD